MRLRKPMGHIFNHFRSQVHIFNKASVGVVSISMGSLDGHGGSLTFFMLPDPRKTLKKTRLTSFSAVGTVERERWARFFDYLLTLNFGSYFSYAFGSHDKHLQRLQRRLVGFGGEFNLFMFVSPCRTITRAIELRRRFTEGHERD